MPNIRSKIEKSLNWIFRTESRIGETLYGRKRVSENSYFCIFYALFYHASIRFAKPGIVFSFWLNFREIVEYDQFCGKTGSGNTLHNRKETVLNCWWIFNAASCNLIILTWWLSVQLFSDKYTQKQSFKGGLQNRSCFEKFCEIHKKTSGMDSFLSKVVNMQSNLI